MHFAQVLRVAAIAAIVPIALSRRSPALTEGKTLVRHTLPQQQPIMAGKPSEEISLPSDDLTISDMINSERKIQTFASFTREVSSISSRLANSSEQSTILAPLNSEIQKLDRKPWEDQNDYDVMGVEAYKGEKGQGRANANLKMFVERHVIPMKTFKEGEKVQTLAGEIVWWETKSGKRVIQPLGIEVDSVAEQVANGELWLIKGVITPH